MPLPTDAELRTALLAFGRLAVAGNYYAALADGISQLSAQEKTDLVNTLELLTRGSITPLEVIDRTTGLPITPFFTAPRQGVYLVVGYFVLTTPAAAGTATVGLSWNDGSGSRSENQLTSVPITVNGQRSFVKALVLGQGQDVSAQVSLAGVSGTPHYNIYARIVEL